MILMEAIDLIWERNERLFRTDDKESLHVFIGRFIMFACTFHTGIGDERTTQAVTMFENATLRDVRTLLHLHFNAIKEAEGST